VLRDIVFPELGVSKVTIAEAMKISRNQLYLILGERQPVMPDTAVRLAAAVGGSPRMWLNMQSAGGRGPASVSSRREIALS
jgi:addiction module HigA family antidote